MWWKRPPLVTTTGSVLFPGTLPPPLATLDGLSSGGVTVTPLSGPTDDVHWVAAARHAEWGDAQIICLRDPPTPPDSLFDQDPRLSSAERATAKRGSATVSVRMERSPGNDALRSRKHLLRFLGAIGGRDAVASIDHTSGGVWSPAALADELAHDADLDVLSLLTIHSVTGADGSPYWHHTHGLAQLGFSELDVVAPGPPSGLTWEVVRAVAFAILEGDLVPGGASRQVVGEPHPPVELIDSATFCKQAGGRFALWRDSLDEEHTRSHAVLCNPAPRGLRAWLGAKPTPWSVLSGPDLGDVPVRFTAAASELMAARARATWPSFMALHEELSDLGFPCLAKLKYVTSDGEGEHLWFEVHGARGGGVDATLANEPWGDIGMRAGDRRTHDLARLSDWVVMTPAGQINPRETRVLRALREHPEVLQAMREDARTTAPA